MAKIIREKVEQLILELMGASMRGLPILRYFEGCLKDNVCFTDRANIPEEFFFKPEESMILWMKSGYFFLVVISYGWLAKHHIKQPVLARFAAGTGARALCALVDVTFVGTGQIFIRIVDKTGKSSPWVWRRRLAEAPSMRSTIRSSLTIYQTTTSWPSRSPPMIGKRLQMCSSATLARTKQRPLEGPSTRQSTTGYPVAPWSSPETHL